MYIWCTVYYWNILKPYTSIYSTPYTLVTDFTCWVGNRHNRHNRHIRVKTENLLPVGGWRYKTNYSQPTLSIHPKQRPTSLVQNPASCFNNSRTSGRRLIEVCSLPEPAGKTWICSRCGAYQRVMYHDRDGFIQYVDIYENITWGYPLNQPNHGDYDIS